MNENQLTPVKVVHANGSGEKIVQSFRSAHEIGEETQVVAIDTEKILNEAEPLNGDLQAVLWKLGAGRFLEFAAGQILMVVASDIEYIDPQGFSRHKPVRMKPSMSEAEYRLYCDNLITKLSALFEQSAANEDDNITSRWLISFGVQLFWQDEQENPHFTDRYLIRLVVQAEFSVPPTNQEIVQSFNEKMNTGFPLVELATSERAVLRVKNNFQEEMGQAWKNISQETVLQMIDQKIIPPWLFAQIALNFFIEQEVVSQPDHGGYQQVLVDLSELDK